MSDVIVVALIAGVFGLINTILTLRNGHLAKDNSRKIEALNINVNGRLEQLLQASRAEGNLKGRQEQTAERAADKS